ncbi:MAG TPA: TonB-dependent receptor [Terriglobales bacterium]|jgi:TonB-dependent receptor|nr:TonB-dependent receptor [Terriglobales bacterium]
MRESMYSLILVGFMIIVLGLTPVNAQQANSRINGLVTDMSGAILPGATVEVEQNGLKAVSDGQGQFTIPNVAPGTYTLKISYVGFSRYETPVTVVAGQPANVTAVLKVSSEGESVLVTAQRAHGEAEAINEEKIADNILNVLPSEVIASLPNANVADAVGRLPGVTLERDEGEGKYVQIRGTEPRLANLTIDGVEVPSPEGGVRQVKLDVIPADLIESVQINKTLQPNMNGDAIGGSVNLVTKKAGDQPTLSVYGLGGFTPIANTRSVYEFGGTAGERFGAAKRLGVMVSGSFDYNGRGIDDIEPVPGLIQQPGSTTFISDFNNVSFRQYLYDRKRYGFGGSLDYRLSENSNLYVHALYSDFKDYGDRYEYILNTNDVAPAVGVSPIPGPNIPNNGPNADGSTPFTTERRDPDFQVASLSLGGNHIFGTSLFNWQIAVGRARMLNPIGGGESHTLFLSNLTQSNCQYLNSATKDPNLPAFSPACFTEAYDPTTLQLNQIQDSAHGKAAQLNLEGTVSYAKNYHLGSHTSTFETGFYIRNAHKFDDSYEIDWCPINPGAAPFATQFLNGFHNSNYYNGSYPYGQGVSWQKVQSYFKANQGAFTNNETLCPQTAPAPSLFGGNNNNFDLVERVTAGYVMDTIDISRLRIVGGLRIEGTQDSTFSCRCDINTNGGPINFPGQGSYVSFLPSVSFRVRLDKKDNSDLRFVFARGLSRPDPAFLTSATTVDNSTTPPTLTIGNPALKPEHGNNYDVLYERYLHPLGVVQAGFFYKSLSDPIVALLAGPKASPGCPTGNCFVNQAVNSGSAYIAGIELNFQQHFSYLPGFLSGFGVSANYSYATSQAKNVNPGFRVDNPALLRQAPNTWNISPTYDRGRVSLRLGVAYNGPNIFAYFFTACQNGDKVNPDGTCPIDPSVTPPAPLPTPGGLKGPSGDQYLYSHFQVDAQGSVYLGKGLTAIAQGLNLNNEVFGFYFGSTPYFSQREYYQPTYTFGLRWDLQHAR